MLGEADVVVIGSGSLGSSVAYHLAKTGKRRIALVDKCELGSQTSPRAAGLSGQMRRTELMTRLAVRGVEKIERFAADTGEPLVFHQPGSLKIARIPEHEVQLREEVALGRRLGIPVDFISPAEAKRLMPFLETKGICAVSHMQTDVYLEPAQLPLGYARAAARLGATLYPNTRVTSIRTRKGTVERVETDRGAIRTGVVVDAAGAWLRAVAELAGVAAPAVPTRHQLLITEPIVGVRPEQPITRIIDANVYVRPDKGGLMLGGYEADPKQYDLRLLPASFEIKDMALDLEVLRELAARVREQLPIFEHTKVREHRGGLPTMTADGEHIIGPAPGIGGLFIVGGCCVGGLTIAPAIGEIVAEWIVDNKPPIEMSSMAPSRFGREISEEALAAACRRQYAHHYWSHASLASAQAKVNGPK
jgi:glycine/D-amino acid oxidase-like deaminating enzyme